jgi:hypothetical protein
VATATPTQPPARAIAPSATPLALWHLLSLDAPTVAVLWTWFIASANHLQLPLTSTLSMALAVWMLYAADRLMDTRLINASQQDLEARHLFHHRHRTPFLGGILLASTALAALLPRLEPPAIHLYLILGVLLSGYFILIHATNSAHRLPKEIAVGLFFAAATYIPTVARRPDLRLTLLPSAILFAALCSLNCLFIYAWEHPSATHRTHPITRAALKNLHKLTILLILASLALLLFDPRSPRPIALAIALSTTLLILLNTRRNSTNPITLRAAADLALTTPLVLLPLLHR